MSHVLRTSSARDSLRSRLAGTPSPRMHQSPKGGGGATRSLQPEQVDGVFQALRRGLKYVASGRPELIVLLTDCPPNCPPDWLQGPSGGAPGGDGRPVVTATRDQEEL